MAKGKKGQKQQQGQQAPQKVENNEQKSKETQQILNAITNMDLDNPDFIDTKAFEQSKAILVNALDDLQLYIDYFNNGEYEKFPKAVESNK